MSKIYIKNLTKRYEDLLVLDNISLDFDEGKVNCIVGSSGCGKSTMLSILSGITKDFEGEAFGFDNDISFVFQEDRLIPWKNVYDNLKLILKKTYNKSDIDDSIKKYLNMINMYDYKNYFPYSLSGGMRQKISLIRAFAYKSKILIMDEPFKSLDINSKKAIIEDFKTLIKEYKRTIILVTHDIDEAINLSDKIIVLSKKPTKIKCILYKSEFENAREIIYSQIE